MFAHGSYNAVVKHINLGDADGAETVFDNEPARNEKTGFKRFTGYYLDEGYVMALIKFSEIMTGEVYSFNITELE